MLALIPIILLASMLGLSVIYFNDVGFRVVLLYWVAFLAGFFLLFLTFLPALYVDAGITGYQAIVVLLFWSKAQMSS